MILRDITVTELSELGNRINENILITGNTALSMNNLIYDSTPITICTNIKNLNCTPGENYWREFYHFKDLSNCKEIADRVYLPTPERAIVDAIVWLPENCNEGQLIEALQTYQDKISKMDELYKLADYYKVPRHFVDYWWKEAEEESDMSMG